MGIGLSRAQAGEVLDAGDNTVALHRVHVGASVGDHRRGRVTPRAQVLVWSIHQLHVHIGSQVFVDTEFQQVVGDAMSQLRRLLWFARLVGLERAGTIAKDTLDALDVAALLV